MADYFLIGKTLIVDGTTLVVKLFGSDFTQRIILNFPTSTCYSHPANPARAEFRFAQLLTSPL